MALFAGGLAGLLGLAGVAGAVRSTASPFDLTFEGRHEAAADSPAGFWHVGPFTASGGFCSAGSATTLGVNPISATEAEAIRLLTCADGSGTVTAHVVTIDREHEGAGSWRIVEGTGKYASLRGQGAFSSVRTGGDPRVHATITFRSTWTGVTDLDDVAPVVDISRATAAKLRRPRGAYLVRIAFAARDAPGNAVRYQVAVWSGFSMLDLRNGETASGTASVAIRVRPLKKVRTLRVQITARDPVGNESTVSRTLKLPR